MKQVFNHINKIIKAQKIPLMPELNVFQKQSSHLASSCAWYMGKDKYIVCNNYKYDPIKNDISFDALLCGGIKDNYSVVELPKEYGNDTNVDAKQAKIYAQMAEKFNLLGYKYGTKAFDSLAKLLNDLGKVSPEWFMKKQGERYFQNVYESITGKKAVGKDYKEFLKLFMNIAAIYSAKAQDLLIELAKRNLVSAFPEMAIFPDLRAYIYKIRISPFMLPPLMFNDWVEEKREELENEEESEIESDTELKPTAEEIEKYAIKYNATYAGIEGYVICKDYVYDKDNNTIVFTATKAQLIADGIIPDDTKEIKFDNTIYDTYETSIESYKGAYEEIERICQEYYNTYGEEGMEIAAEVLNEMEEDTGTLEERLEIIEERIKKKKLEEKRELEEEEEEVEEEKKEKEKPKEEEKEEEKKKKEKEKDNSLKRFLESYLLISALYSIRGRYLLAQYAATHEDFRIPESMIVFPELRDIILNNQNYEASQNLNLGHGQYVRQNMNRNWQQL